MATFPITRSQLTLSGQSGAVRQSVDASSGVPQEFAAMGDFGNVLFREAVLFHRKQGQTELTEYKAKVQDARNQMLLGFESNQDESTYQGIWEKEFSKLQQDRPKNGWAAQQYDMVLTQLKPAIDAEVINEMVKKGDEKYKFSLTTDMSKGIDRGDLSAFELRLESDVANELLPQERADQLLAYARPKAEKQALYNQMDGLREAAYQTGNYDQGAAIIESSNIPRRFKNSLKAELGRSIEERDFNVFDTLRQRLDSGELDHKTITDLGLGIDEELKWLDRIDNSKRTDIKTNYKSWTADFEKVLSVWNREKTAAEISEELVNSRYDNKDLTQEDYNNLIGMLGKNYPAEVLPSINSVFKGLQSQVGPLWYQKNSKWLADTQMAIMSWVDNEIANGRIPEPRKVYIQARSLGASNVPRPNLQYAMDEAIRQEAVTGKPAAKALKEWGYTEKAQKEDEEIDSLIQAGAGVPIQ